MQLKGRSGRFGTVVRMHAQDLTTTGSPGKLTEELLARMDLSGPRYTSYPTADRFVDAFDAAHYRQALRQRADGAGVLSGMVGGGLSPLSIYVHVPFCESVCYYCACNKVVTRHHERAAEYLDALQAEVALHVQAMGQGQPVSQLHLGGGTPTFLSDAELDGLMQVLRRAFKLAPGGEYAIEVDPRTVDAARLRRLAEMGFNRLSFGVQDNDPDVQKAIHRIQPWERTAELVQAARELRFDSVNTDLIYGLPRQTSASFGRTLEQVAAVRPDRIALYAYAHLPQRFKPQRRIVQAELPMAAEKVAMLSKAIGSFLGHGYQYIGMDHFALPGDSLAVARRQGRLHRNFQGYSTQPDCDLIGLGVSAIGRMGASYSQNARELPGYYDALRRGEFATVRGIALSRDDLVRRAVIMALMCQGRVDFESIGLSHLIDARRYFAPEIAQLCALEQSGLVRVGADGIDVTDLGWYFVRGVAMVFDRHLQADQALSRFSRII